MRRRSYLATTAAALAGAAGCLSRSAGQATTPSTTTTATTTSTTARPGGSVSVRAVTLQPAIVFLQTDYLTVRGGGQYLLVEVAVEGTLAREEFAFRFAGETHDPMPDHRSRRLWRVYNRGGYDPDAGGLLVFGLPASAGTADPEAVLEWAGGEYAVGADLQRRLAAGPPPLSFSASVPETVAVGASPALELAVTNGGDVPGRFVAGLNRSGPRVASAPVERFSVPVAPGETARVEYVDDRVTGGEVASEEVGDGEPDAEYRLNALERDLRWPVRYVASNR